MLYWYSVRKLVYSAKMCILRKVSVLRENQYTAQKLVYCAKLINYTEMVHRCCTARKLVFCAKMDILRKRWYT